MPNKEIPDANILHSFAGQWAASANIATLAEARRRVQAQMDPERVRRETGWFVGLDGQWRFEISDDQVTTNKRLLSNLEKGGFKERSIERITYRQDADGTYQLLLAPKNPQTLSDLVSLKGIPREALGTILTPSAAKAIDRGEGEQDLIGDFEEARAMHAPFEFGGFNAIPLDIAMGHPALFHAYPDLQDVMVAVDPKLGNGAKLSTIVFDDDTQAQVIYLGNPKHRDVASALLHEVQHCIQRIEGFASGGSPHEFRDVDLTEKLARPISDQMLKILRDNPEFGDLRREHTRDWIRIAGAHGKPDAQGQETLDWDDVPAAEREAYFERMAQLDAFPEHFEYMDLEDERARIYREAPSISAQEQYQRLAGEVEARNTQARMNLSPAQRLTTPPGDTADTPAADVIVKPSADLPSPTSTTQPAKATKTTLVAALQTLVNGAGELGGALGQVVAATADEIKSHWAPLIGADARTSTAAGTSQGFYEASSKTIFLVADNINAGDELGVIAHELMHKHGKAVLGQAGWDHLHGAIREWGMAPLGSTERFIHDEATRRVNESLGAAQTDLEHSSHELFPYAVEVALRIGVKPQREAPKGSARAWLGQVRDTLGAVWAKISGKPKEMTTQDLVTLAYGIAQRESPDHQGELDAERDNGPEGRLEGPGGSNATLKQDLRISMRDLPIEAEQSHEFAKWFGQSKAVDAQGRPLVLYHGSNAEFTVFDHRKIGKNGRAEGAGFYFTDSQQVSSGYGKPMQVYVSIQKPLRYDTPAFDLVTTQKILRRASLLEAQGNNTAEENGFLSNFGDVSTYGVAAIARSAATTLAREETALDQLGGLVGSGVPPEIVNQAAHDITGYDGVVTNGFSDRGDGSSAIYVAFFANQIKSATHNNGEYNKENPDIRFSTPDKPDGFNNWFGRSHVVDAHGLPLVVYRGEHGDGGGQPRTAVGTFTFTDDAAVASTYASAPNDRRNFPFAQAPHVIPAYLSLQSPIIKNVDDPFVEFADLAQKLGRHEAERFARKHSDSIMNTDNWDSNYADQYASVDALLDDRPDQLASLYMNAYVLLDDLAFVQAAKEAGFDGGYRGDRPNKTTFTGHEDASAFIKGNIFFSSDPNIGKFYTKHRTNYMLEHEKIGVEDGLYRVFLSLQNPLVTDAKGADWSALANPFEPGEVIQIDDLAAMTNAKGYDGLIVRNVWDQAGNGDQFIAFRPEQIKSATENNGQFDKKNPDIRFSMPSIKPRVPFAEWFGDSKVTKEDGNPQVVYHGTIVRPDTDKAKGMGDIQAFDRLFTTQFRSHSVDTMGSWFSTNPGELGAQMYSGLAQGAVIYPVFLSIQNPHETTFELMERRARLLANGKDDGRRLGKAEVDAYRYWLKEIGKDGIKIVHDGYNARGSTEFKHQDAWIALEPHQIQFALGINAPSEKQAQDMALRAAGVDNGPATRRLHESERQAWARYREKAIEKGAAALERGERLESASVIALAEEGLLAPDHPQFPGAQAVDAMPDTPPPYRSR